MNAYRRRGAVAVGTAVGMVVLLGFVALAVDVGYMCNVRGKLQNIADASALAGASALSAGPSSVRARARNYVDVQTGPAQPDTQDDDVILGRWDKEARTFTPLSGDDEAAANAVRVLTQMSEERGNPVNLFFASVLGFKKTTITATATATFGSEQPWNVVIAQDITNSFVNELSDARIADQALLDCIKEHAGKNSQVGIVAFTGYGKVISTMKNVDTNYTSLTADITKLKNCGSTGMPPCSGTNIGAGLDSAIGLLANLNSEYPKAIVLVSDGMPSSSLRGYSDADLADWAIRSADTADTNGISVFTLFYGGNDTNANADEFLASLVRGRGTAHATLSAAEMAVKLKEMCREGLSLMLVE